ncbi:hypothetical protein Plhal304r1_c054g0138831 [Plasmopara halstedii]
MRPTPVVLAPVGTAANDEELFKRWVQRHRRLSSLSNLQQSTKAQRRLPEYCRPATHGAIHHAPTKSAVSHMGGYTTTAAQSYSMSSARGFRLPRLPPRSLGRMMTRGIIIVLIIVYDVCVVCRSGISNFHEF